MARIQSRDQILDCAGTACACQFNHVQGSLNEHISYRTSRGCRRYGTKWNRAAKLIHRLGGHALVSDIKPADALTAAIEELKKEGIETENGGHHRLLTEKFDLVVLSPGVVPSAELQKIWDSQKTPIWSELELAARSYADPWIGVTGSNGKTTTVNLIAQILNAAGKNTIMAGNVGQAWSNFLPAKTDTAFVVEVSSFQLENAITVKPHVGLVLNLFENHLDRHASMEEYASLKTKLLLNQSQDDFAILNGDDDRVRQMSKLVRSQVIWFGLSNKYDFWTDGEKLMYKQSAILPVSELPLVGRHNYLNSLAAAAAAHAFGIEVEPIRAALKAAQGVEHRIELVTVIDGVTFINDSKSTNMTATLTALEAFPKDVILLFGGRPKRESFAVLAKRFPNPVKKLIYFGEASEKIKTELPASLPMIETDTMYEAVQLAKEIAQEGDTVLLSPGCASYDQFNNFEERGRFFKTYVME